MVKGAPSVRHKLKAFVTICKGHKLKAFDAWFGPVTYMYSTADLYTYVL